MGNWSVTQISHSWENGTLYEVKSLRELDFMKVPVTKLFNLSKITQMWFSNDCTITDCTFIFKIAVYVERDSACNNKVANLEVTFPELKDSFSKLNKHFVGTLIKRHTDVPKIEQVLSGTLLLTKPELKCHFLENTTDFPGTLKLLPCNLLSTSPENTSYFLRTWQLLSFSFLEIRGYFPEISFI